MYPINTVTALPLFQLMCALEGREAGTLALRLIWPIFLDFCRLPARSEEDSPGFQAEVSREGVDTPVLEVRLVRQLTDDALGYGRLTRVVYANFFFDQVPDDLDGAMLWARDFASLEEFREAVEATPEYQWALGQVADHDGFEFEDAGPLDDAG